MKTVPEREPVPVIASKTMKPWHFGLLLLPYLGLLWPAAYARYTPTLLGFPFFYWYQFLWVILSAAITAFVYWRTRF